jgi:hypothetical protein
MNAVAMRAMEAYVAEGGPEEEFWEKFFADDAPELLAKALKEADERKQIDAKLELLGEQLGMWPAEKKKRGPSAASKRKPSAGRKRHAHLGPKRKR